MGLKTPLTPHTFNCQHNEASMVLVNDAQTVETVFVDNYIILYIYIFYILFSSAFEYTVNLFLNALLQEITENRL